MAADTKYFLMRAVIGSGTRLPLSVEQYDALQRARKRLTPLLAFEEEWDVVLQNYMELELGFLSAAMHSMIHSHTDTNELRRSRLTFTRLLGNLLSSCRSYLDHAPHYLGQLDGEQAEVFLARTREAYDAELGYRFMEALRNHAQHRGSPLHGTSFNSRWVERDSEDTFLQYSVGASVNVDDLRADRKFKRSILKDFAEDERIDVLAMARIYIEKLGQLHSQCRDDTSSLMERNKRLLRSALDRYQRETGESRIGVAIARSNNDRTVQSFDHLPEDVIDWYESLVKRNRNVVNLRKRFVSNELLPERKGSPRGI